MWITLAFSQIRQLLLSTTYEHRYDKYRGMAGDASYSVWRSISGQTQIPPEFVSEVVAFQHYGLTLHRWEESKPHRNCLYCFCSHLFTLNITRRRDFQCMALSFLCDILLVILWVTTITPAGVTTQEYVYTQMRNVCLGKHKLTWFLEG